MPIILDETTRAEYLAQTVASTRASLVVSALTEPVVVEVFNGSNSLRATGTMTSPWATASGSTITVNGVTAAGITVSAGGGPTSLWYCQFRGANGRFVRGTFGLPGQGRDFTWSLPSFDAGSRGTIGSIVMSAEGVLGIVTAPSISGTAQVGQQITGDNGTWTGTPTAYVYQHQRSVNGTSGWSNISGATAAAYTLTSADLGAYVRRGVAAVNAAGTSSFAYSAASAQVVSSGSQALLSAADITYLGEYTVDLSGYEIYYGAGLTVRRVGADSRLITWAWASGNTGPFVEFSLSGRSYGQTINTATRFWPSTGVALNSNPRRSIFWDEANSKLWALQAHDYPDGATDTTTHIKTMTLGSSGVAVSDVREFKLSGVPDRKAFSGAMTVPASAQAAYGYGPYIVGLGGYTSLVDNYGGAALGPSLRAIPNPTALANNAVIPSGSIKTLASYSGSSQRGNRIWYGYNFTATGTYTFGVSPGGGINPGDAYYGTTVASGTLTGKGPISYWDGGDPRTRNPSTPPTWDPAPFSGPGFGQQADGHALWTAQDGQYYGGFYLDGPTRKGVVLVASLPTGRSYYMSSDNYTDGQCAEVHVFDPEQLAEVAAGTRSGSTVKPVAYRALAECDASVEANFYAAYDPAANYGDGKGRLYVFPVLVWPIKLRVYAVQE